MRVALRVDGSVSEDIHQLVVKADHVSRNSGDACSSRYFAFADALGHLLSQDIGPSVETPPFTRHRDLGVFLRARDGIIEVHGVDEGFDEGLVIGTGRTGGEVSALAGTSGFRTGTITYLIIVSHQLATTQPSNLNPKRIRNLSFKWGGCATHGEGGCASACSLVSISCLVVTPCASFSSLSAFHVLHLSRIQSCLHFSRIDERITLGPAATNLVLLVSSLVLADVDVANSPIGYHPTLTLTDLERIWNTRVGKYDALAVVIARSVRAFEVIGN